MGAPYRYDVSRLRVIKDALLKYQFIYYAVSNFLMFSSHRFDWPSFKEVTKANSTHIGVAVRYNNPYQTVAVRYNNPYQTHP